jgi:predicted ATP-grasp superfamily ATP-dependent carboligase
MIRMGETAPGRTVFVHEYVTGGGLAGSVLPASWQAEGAAMRRALAADFARLPGLRVVATLDARLPDEPGPWMTVRVGPGEERTTFARLAAEADCTALIAPETDGILLARTRIIEDVGGRSLGSTPEAIALAGQKHALGLLLRRLGIPSPPGRLIDPREGLPRDVPYPAVLKPPDGAGAVATYYLADADAWPAGVERPEVALIQRYVVGEPMSASFLVADGRAHLVGVGRQRVEIRDGRFVYRGGTVPAEFCRCDDHVRRAVAAVPGLRGWVGVDFLWDEEEARAVVLEINPRLTTSYVGLRRLLPAGELTRAWLSALDGAAEDATVDLARRIHAGRPLTFEADGTILSGDSVATLVSEPMD